MINLKPSGPWNKTPWYLFWKPKYRRHMFWSNSNFNGSFIHNDVWIYSNQDGIDPDDRGAKYPTPIPLPDSTWTRPPPKPE